MHKKSAVGSLHSGRSTWFIWNWVTAIYQSFARLRVLRRDAAPLFFFFGDVLIEYPCFDQTLQAYCFAGDAMNMHGVVAVPPHSDVPLWLVGLPGGRWHRVVPGAWGSSGSVHGALGIGSWLAIARCALPSLRLRRLPFLLGNEIL